MSRSRFLKILLAMFAAVPFFRFAAKAQAKTGFDREARNKAGIPLRSLYGNVRVVGENADYNISISSGYADLYVKICTDYSENITQAGVWRFVDETQRADFTVRIVDSGDIFFSTEDMPDIDVRFVPDHAGARPDVREFYS